MQIEMLQISQYVLKHPIMGESEKYKKRYINTLEYFVNKYSPKEKFSKSMLELYKKRLLINPECYEYRDEGLKKISKGILSWKMKKFKFFSYRYCLLIDVVFMCSFLDITKAEMVYQEILGIYNKRYWKKLEELFSVIVGKSEDCEHLDQTDYLMKCIKANRDFLCNDSRNVLVTANMSAGKSTLLNAIIGKKVNKTQNDACTAKTHYLINKAFEDNLSYDYDYDLELDASREILMEDNESNSSSDIYVGTRFRTIGDINVPICFIDTPGVNSSQDKVHREISEKNIVDSKYEKLIYIMNGENIGTEDDRRHLEFVAENYKGAVIFVINKLDRYRKEDSIPDTLQQVKKDLEELGYKQPIICPVSAYAAYLAKMSMYDEELNDDEIDELDIFYRKLRKEEYQLNRYYPVDYQDISITEDANQKLLLHSGLLSLEKILYEER